MFCPLVKGECREDCIFFDKEIPPPPETQCEFFYAHRRMEAVATNTNQVYAELVNMQKAIYELNAELKDFIATAFSENNSDISELKENIIFQLDEISTKVGNIEFDLRQHRIFQRKKQPRFP